MTILILGGGALGEQACRLAEAAGIHTVAADEPLPTADFVLPATEDETLLRGLSGENVLFDKAAWALASSRLASDAFLRERGIPVPEYFPGGSEPYIVKPDRGSFGRGIWVTEDFCEVGGAVNAGFVTQEELPGDVWSVCVLGKPGGYAAYAPAKITFDGRRRRTAAQCAAPPEETAPPVETPPEEDEADAPQAPDAEPQGEAANGDELYEGALAGLSEEEIGALAMAEEGADIGDAGEEGVD